MVLEKFLYTWYGFVDPLDAERAQTHYPNGKIFIGAVIIMMQTKTQEIKEEH